MQDLAALIEEVKEANQWVDADIAERAQRAGHHLTGPNVRRMRVEPINAIKPGPMRALAAALDLPVDRVVRAALVSLGVPLRETFSTDLETAIRVDASLSVEQKRSLLVLLASFGQTYGLAARRGPKDD